MKINEKIYNVVNGEETIIERDLTFEEKETQLQVTLTIAENKIICEQVEQNKAALLQRLGITADEAKLLSL
jgi:hypothetical protein